MPDVCRTCKNNDDIDQYIFCEMRRIKRQHHEVFECAAYIPISTEIEEERL